MRVSAESRKRKGWPRATTLDNTLDRKAVASVRQDVHTAASELYDPVFECEQSIVASATHVPTGFEGRAPLPDDDGACPDALTTENLHAEVLRIAVTAVTR